MKTLALSGEPQENLRRMRLRRRSFELRRLPGQHFRGFRADEDGDGALLVFHGDVALRQVEGASQALDMVPGSPGVLELHASQFMQGSVALPDFEVIAWHQVVPTFMLLRKRNGGDPAVPPFRSRSSAGAISDRAYRAGLSSPCRPAAWRARSPSSASRRPWPRS